MTPQAQQMIDQFEADIADMRMSQAALSNVLLGDGWIVRCEGVYLAFEIRDNKAVSSRVCGRPTNATRFTERDARAVAENVKNGRGTRGEIVHINQALIDEIAELQRLIQIIRDAQAKAND